MNHFSATTVAVTGGARGIGAAIAEAFAAQGARVAIGDLDLGPAAELAARCGNAAQAFSLDVTSDRSVRTFVEEVERDLGPIDIFVNNAGIMWVGAFEDEPEAVALRQFDVNVHGAARAMRAIVPRMRERGAGHVITVASAASKVAPAGEATYSATKHAIYGYNVALRAELHGSGVDLSVVMPAVVETGLASGTSHGAGRRLRPQDVADAVVAAAIKPRFEVFVPRSLNVLTRVAALLPDRARHAMARALVPDQLRSARRDQRAAYEAASFGAAVAGAPAGVREPGRGRPAP